MSSAKTTTVVKGVIWSFAEKVSAQLVSFLVSVVLARILSPDDYGLVSMILVFITILMSLLIADSLLLLCREKMPVRSTFQLCTIQAKYYRFLFI